MTRFRFPARRFPLRAGVAGVALSVACATTAPVSYMGVTSPGKEDAFECAVAQLNLMGYNIEDGNADIGYVRGRKQTSGLAEEILLGNAYVDLLTVSAFDNPQTGATHLRAVASQLADKDISLLGGVSLDEDWEEGERLIEPSETGKADAQALLSNCGVSQITGPPSGAGPLP